MKPIFVIESVIHPGSFYSERHNAFKGFLFTTRYENFTVVELAIKKVVKIEPCMITKVYIDE